MESTKPICLILACGNTLREDDGVGPWLADWAKHRFAGTPGLEIISRQQWTPELSQDIAQADSVLFIDLAADAAPGSVELTPVAPDDETAALATHHLGAGQLLSLSQQLYGSFPGKAMLLTIGSASTELREGFSDPVTAALPQACSLLEKTVLQFLAKTA
jgi:hydrogenase maturation protease